MLEHLILAFVSYNLLCAFHVSVFLRFILGDILSSIFQVEFEVILDNLVRSSLKIKFFKWLGIYLSG